MLISTIHSPILIIDHFGVTGSQAVCKQNRINFQRTSSNGRHSPPTSKPKMHTPSKISVFAQRWHAEFNQLQSRDSEFSRAAFRPISQGAKCHQSFLKKFTTGRTKKNPTNSFLPVAESLLCCETWPGIITL